MCDVVKKNQNTMFYHYKKHAGDLPHACKECNMRFLHNSILVLHIASKHPTDDTRLSAKVFTCPEKGCDYSAATKANRRIHYIRSHLKDVVDQITSKEVDDKSNKYICMCCKIKMNSQTALYYHIGNCINLSEEDSRLKDWKDVIEC